MINVFKTLNATIEKPSYTIDIKNIDHSDNHWGPEKRIMEYFDSIDTFLYQPDKLNKNIITHVLKLLKSNPRIEDIKFYKIPEENKLILLVYSDVREFNKYEIFSKEISAKFKKDNFKFSIIEILKSDMEELKAGAKTIPEHWKLDEELTNRLNKYKYYDF